ncbi:hypothetical protein GCM10010430_38880 [Kitasatospora cystarginea]|uniref:Uncharacterized protein n=1 Tax=Kitasatospora cystarginea TaxID=58350 RepID=A0ABN3EAI2_9ACTN
MAGTCRLYPNDGKITRRRESQSPGWARGAPERSRCFRCANGRSGPVGLGVRTVGPDEGRGGCGCFQGGPFGGLRPRPPGDRAEDPVSREEIASGE